MPTSIPAGQQNDIEVISKGIAAAAGSTSKNMFNVWHFRRTSGAAALIKANIEGAFNTAIMLPFLAAVNIRYTQTFTSIRIMNDPLDQAQDFVRAGVGAITGDSMASEDVAFIKLSTGYKGKSYRGNKKIGPMSESDTTTTSDVFVAAAITRLQAIITAFLAGFSETGNTWIPTIYSRMLDEFAVKPAVTAWPCISGALNKRVSSINRRKTPSVY
jgi:hypothetical protein